MSKPGKTTAVESESHNLPYPKPALAWKATLFLAVLYWLSILDRFIIALLVDPIKRDLSLSDVQFGMLHGLAFAVTYALFGLAAGALADRVSRRRIIFISVSVWSLATAACGLAQNFWHLLLARIGVGAGEAGLNPSATSMLTDLFPREKLTSAMAVYALGATLGSGMAYIFGGMIVDLVSQTESLVIPMVGEMRSWQAVFIIIGVPGTLLSLVIFAVPEPVRRDKLGISRKGNYLTEFTRSYSAMLSFMRPHGRFFLCHYVGFGLASMVLASGAIWYPAHMGRSFGWSAGEIGLYLGLTLMIAGIAGKLIGGWAMDAMYRSGSRDAQLRWYARCLLVAAPVGVIATSSDSPWVFLTGMGLFLILLSPLPACANTALNLITPNELRGTGVALFSASAGMIGSACGPILVAALSDHFFDQSIGTAMGAVIAVCCPLAAIVLALGYESMRYAARKAEGLSAIQPASG